MELPHSVSGIILDASGNAAPDGTGVHLYRRDLKSRRLLATETISGGEGHFLIVYGEGEPEDASGRPQHLEIRVFDVERRLRATSDTVFFAPQRLERLNLQFAQIDDREASKAEFDQLRQALEAAAGLDALPTLSQEEIQFLVRTVVPGLDLAKDVEAEHIIHLMVQAVGMAPETGLRVDAIYALLRLDPSLSAADINALLFQDLVNLLETAVRYGFVAPDVPQRSLTRRRDPVSDGITFPPPVALSLVVTLVDAAGGAPLANTAFSIVDNETGGLGTTLTSDENGIARVDWLFASSAPWRLLIVTLDPSLQRTGEGTLDVTPNSQELSVEVSLSASSNPLNIPIAELTDRQTAAELREQGILDIGTVLRSRESLPGIPEGTARDLIRRAGWIAAGLEVTERDVMAELGLTSLLEVAQMDRARFVERAGTAMGGTAAAASFHAAALQYHRHVARQMGDAWLEIETREDDDPDDEDRPDIGSVFEDENICGCDDCESALGPSAYLAHLLEWITNNVVSAGAPITLQALEEGFHQPFGELPTSCDFVLEKVPQVRLAIEVLWRFTGGPSSQGETVFNAAHAEYRRQAYREILGQFGLIYDDLLLAEAESEEALALRLLVANRLGIEPEDVADFQFPDPPSEVELETAFGLRRTDLEPTANLDPPMLLTRQGNEFGRLWLQEDSDRDAYGPEQSLPAIDPRVIGETAFRLPRDDTNAAFSLFEERRDLLLAERTQITNAAVGSDTLLAEIAGRIAVPVSELQDVRDMLQGVVPDSDPDEIETARQRVTDEFLLNVPSFLRLVDIVDQLESDGANAFDDTALVADCINILVGHHAVARRDDWIIEEANAGIRLGSEMFHAPDAPDLAPSAFLVPQQEWTGWRTALQRRSSDPIIDPHHLTEPQVVQFSEPGFEEFASDTAREALLDLLDARMEWAETRRQTLSAARQAAGGIAAQYTAVLAESVVPDLETQIDDLLNREADGHSITQSINQLGFSVESFRRVVELGDRAESGLPLVAEHWDDIFALLIALEKQLLATEWRAEERDAGITLHPKLFLVPEIGTSVSQNASVFALRAGFARTWENRLQIRSDQLAESADRLNLAVARAEELALVILRDALIRRSASIEVALEDQRLNLDQRLLVALDLDGCVCTTRTAFAIDTLQRFLRAILQGDLIDALSNVEIDVENLEAAASLLSYQEWRSAIFAFLWPENLTTLALPRRVSHGLNRLTARLPNRLTPNEACQLAQDYSQYYRDVSGLRVSASCYAPTFVKPEDPCDPEDVSVRDRLFVFGHATGPNKSGQVYWAMLDPLDRPGDTRTTWAPLGRLGSVEQFLGATVHVGAKPLVLIFARVEEGNSQSLVMRAFDLEEGRWRRPQTLRLPQAAERGFRAAPLRKYASASSPTSFETNLLAVPTLVALDIDDGGVFIRALSTDLSGWEPNGWEALQGPSASTRLVDLVQIRNNEAALLLETDDEAVHCRTVSLENPYLHDDFDHRHMGPLHRPYGGSIGWPNRNELISFTRGIGAGSSYRIADFETTALGIPNSSPRFSEDFIQPIEERLRDEFGVSLDDPTLFRFVDFRPFLWVPKYIGGVHQANVAPTNTTMAYNPLNVTGEPLNVTGEEEQGQEDRRPSLEPFSGTLYDLMTMNITQFNGMIGDFDNESAYINGDQQRNFYLIQYKKLGLDHFFAALDTIGETDPFGSPASWWGFIDAQIQRLSQGVFDLRSMLTQTFHNSIEGLVETFGWDATFEDSIRPVVFQQRVSDIAVSTDRTAGAEQIWIAGTAGYDNLPDRPQEKPIALWRDAASPTATLQGGSYWTISQRSGSFLTAPAAQRITPASIGSFAIVPPDDPAELIDRREASQSAYLDNPDAPPSIVSLFREMFFLVPTLLGDALCRSGYYKDANKWFWMVYNDRIEPGQRKIDYGLVLEENRPLSYAAIDDWLRDPEDVHAIALSRRETDTRRILISLIACRVAQADALFSRDLPETISEARELYRNALDLIVEHGQRTGARRCADIIGSLRFELEGRDVLPIDQWTLRLDRIPLPADVQTTVDSIIAVAREPDTPPRSVAAQVRRIIASAVPSELAPRPISETMARRDRLMRRGETQLLSREPQRRVMAALFSQSRTMREASIACVSRSLGVEPAQASWLAIRRDPPPPPRDPDRARRGLSRFAAIEARATIQPLAQLHLADFEYRAPTTGTVLSFCIPRNPEVEALRLRAETALERIRTCRDIAGFERLSDPYGGPIGLGNLGISPGVPNTVDIPPVPLRYSALLPRAKELADTASSIEARYQHALESEDRERLTQLQVTQNLEVAEARVARGSLAVTAAQADVELADRQRETAIIAADHYDGLIKAGLNEHERNVIKHYTTAGQVDGWAKAFKALKAIGTLGAGAIGIGNPLNAVQDIFDLAEGIKKSKDATALKGTQSGIEKSIKGLTGLVSLNKDPKIDVAALEGFNADLIRREQTWTLQRDLARQEIEIGRQEIAVAQFAVELARTDLEIALLQRSHAADMLVFLQTKNLTAEAYRWMAVVLGEAYREILQRAAATARMAERALAFERYQRPAGNIAGDYWQVDLAERPEGSVAPDLRGLTGSARLLRDLSRLEGHAIATLRRRVPIEFKLELTRLDPESFAQFRETGVLEFETTLETFQQQLPGYFMAIIDQVEIDLFALTLPEQGLRMTLESRGISRAIVRAEGSRSTIVRGLPEVRHMTGTPIDAHLQSFRFDEDIRQPFEGTAFNQFWRISAPKAANLDFDYDLIAAIEFKLRGTALYSPLYAEQVLEELGPSRRGDIVISLAADFDEAWEALPAAATEGEALTIAFDVLQTRLPANLADVRVENVLIAVISDDKEETRLSIFFEASDSVGRIGGDAETIDGRISTRNATGAVLSGVLDGSAAGSFEITFDENTRARFEEAQIADLIVAISFVGEVA